MSKTIEDMSKTIEDIIYEHLKALYADVDTCPLAVYGGVPAIFNTKAPDDTDELWETENQYPRIVFELSMQADPERKVSGRLFIDVMCLNTLNDTQPESLETAVKGSFDGCFFSNEELTISAQWVSSEPFSEKDNELSGITLAFDVMAYPVQITESPDPVACVNEWLKTLYQNSHVIGKDVLPQTWKPTNETPALYCRVTHLGESPMMKNSAAVTWIGADMKVYVMAPDEQVRSTISKQIIQLLPKATTLILDDGSPLLIQRVQGNLGADMLKEGQIQIKATYGVLNEYIGTPIKQISINGMNAESEVIA